jgi:lipoyl(octanoyl) transferase
MPLHFHWLGRVSYADGLRRQEELAAKRREGRVDDTVLLLEHEPVYTIGRTTNKSSLAEVTALPHRVVEISRGGQATYHGPGQLVGYPILDLTRYGQDLHRYLRALEEALLAACATVGVSARRRESLTGVWVGERKLASIGVGVRHWISQHGFAINVTEECLAGFEKIVPCGIADVQMTCLEREGATVTSCQAFAAIVQPALQLVLDGLRR